MALDSALVILMAEVLVAMILLAGVLFFISRNKRTKEIRAINAFIDQMEEQALFKNQPLEQLLSQTCGFDAKTVKESLQNIGDAERALMQKVIQFFLSRETTLLNEIDRCIGDLSEPYSQLLSSIANSNNPAPAGNVQSLERINQQLVRQLDTAMETIDEITAEYTRVFNGNQSELELENFQETMQHLKQIPQD